MCAIVSGHCGGGDFKATLSPVALSILGIHFFFSFFVEIIYRLQLAATLSGIGRLIVAAWEPRRAGRAPFSSITHPPFGFFFFIIGSHSARVLIYANAPSPR